jgi:hypothetical protein
MSFQSSPSLCVCMYPPTARRGDPLVRKAAASLFLSLAGAAKPEGFVTDVDDAMEAHLRGVSR